MTELHHTIRHIPLPLHMRSLKISDKGYPIPFFVDYLDGKPEFRATDPRKLKACVEKKLCWICGNPLGRNMAFTIGPMCAINRVSSEPPEHLDCALYSVEACPFLSRPNAVRREAGLPEGFKGNVAGVMIERNPGVSLVWITRTYRPFSTKAGRGSGVLFEIGDPIGLQWFREGRPATRDEIMQSIDEGYPALVAASVAEGPASMEALAKAREDAMALLPA